jgi:hypothetical protein
MLGSVNLGMGSVPTADGADGGGGAGGRTWYELEAAAHAQALSQPQLESVPIPMSLNHVLAIIGANVAAGNPTSPVEGGSLRGLGAAWNHLLPGNVWNDMGTSYIGCSWQASMAAIAVGVDSYLGLKNPLNGQQIVFGTDRTVSLTRFIAFTYDGVAIQPAGGVDLGLADANVWTWRLTINGTVATMSRCAAAGGGVPLASGTVLTANPNFPVGFPASPAFKASTLAVGQAITKCLFSFVGPQ